MKTDRFIQGIYNYCDYWCERCAFTRRCRNFSMDRERGVRSQGEKTDEDAVNAAFWNRLADTLREETVFGQTDEGEFDDLPDFDDFPDPQWEAQQEAHQHAVRKHPLSQLAENYRDCVERWIKSAEADLKAVAQELLNTARSRFATEDVEEEAREIGEMIEVVSWYHTLLPPKLSRAVSGLLERDRGDSGVGMLAELRTEDANGSGKVALIAIERSMSAWLRLRVILPSHEDAILHMLAMLDRLRHGIDAALPGAKRFLRPGFDDGARG